MNRYDENISWDLAVLAEKVGFGEADRLNETTIHGLQRWLRDEKLIYVIVNVSPTFATSNKVMFDWTIKWNSDGANMNKIEPYYCDSTYYAALENGLKEALNMLINGEINGN